MNIVIINESHSLFEEQKKLLDERFGNNWEFLRSPENGWTLEEMEKIASEHTWDRFIFASPIPALMALMQESSEENQVAVNHMMGTPFMVFHNDNREAKELPGGKIIHSVSKTGWILI